MTSTLGAIVVIALLDSTSMVPIALVPLAAMLGGRRPYAEAMAFLAGIGLAYFLAGAVLLIGVGQLFAVLDAYFQRVWFQPNRLELILQIVVGAVLLLLAWRLVRLRGTTASPQPGATGLAGAFMLGVVLTLVGLPGAVPYVGAIDQILRADADLITAGLLLLAYNVAFLVPLFLLVGVRMLFPRQSARVLDVVGDVLARWGMRVVIVLLSLLGAVMVADGIGWLLGQPLIPVGSPPPGF